MSRGKKLFDAAKAGDREQCEEEIKLGADLEFRFGGWTPLIVAAENGHYDVIKFLVEMGSDVEARDGAGWTSLMYAVSLGHFAVVEYLVRIGCSVHAHADDGK